MVAYAPPSKLPGWVRMTAGEEQRRVFVFTARREGVAEANLDTEDSVAIFFDALDSGGHIEVPQIFEFADWRVQFGTGDQADAADIEHCIESGFRGFDDEFAKTWPDRCPG